MSFTFSFKFLIASFVLLCSFPSIIETQSFFEVILSHQKFLGKCDNIFKCDKDIGLQCFMGSCICEANSFFDTASSSLILSNFNNIEMAELRNRKKLLNYCDFLIKHRSMLNQNSL